MLDKKMISYFLGGLVLFLVTNACTASPPIHPLNNTALGYICKGEFRPLSPFGFVPKVFNKTQMQEAMSPQPIELNLFEGKLIQLQWQLAEGETLWGVTITPVSPSQLYIRWNVNDKPLQIPALPKQ